MTVTYSRSCQHKIRHDSKAAALNARKAWRRRCNYRSGHLNVYHCEFCDGWHLGHPQKRR